MRAAVLAPFLLALLLPLPSAQAASPAVELAGRYRIIPDLTYLVADGYESKLDLVLPLETSGPAPTLLYIHGGGWVQGTKEGSFLQVLPYLEMGFAVVNVEYRLAKVALAPGAVEDCRCALRWIKEHAKEHQLDPERIVVTGHSAGGHLSLTTGMLPAAAGFDRRCPARDPEGRGPVDALEPELSVAAVVNWFGITDVGDLLAGPNAKTYAVAWMGSLPDRQELARQVSPLHWVRSSLPPILTIHGDADTIVPYDQAVRLHAALEKVGATQQLHTIAGGGHGGFNLVQLDQAYGVIRSFLEAHVLKDAAAPSTSGGSR